MRLLAARIRPLRRLSSSDSNRQQQSVRYGFKFKIEQRIVQGHNVDRGAFKCVGGALVERDCRFVVVAIGVHDALDHTENELLFVKEPRPLLSKNSIWIRADR